VGAAASVDEDTPIAVLKVLAGRFDDCNRIGRVRSRCAGHTVSVEMLCHVGGVRRGRSSPEARFEIVEVAILPRAV
jgi:hypothetical protein